MMARPVDCFRSWAADDAWIGCLSYCPASCSAEDDVDHPAISASQFSGSAASSHGMDMGENERGPAVSASVVSVSVPTGVVDQDS